MTDQQRIFLKNIESVLIIDSIHKYMESQITAFDISELLRAEYVLIVSALDFYIHEIVRVGLLNLLESTNSCAENSVCIPLSTVQVLMRVQSEGERKRILDEQLKKITSKDSYQAPRAIEKALGMINIKRIWTKVSGFIDKSPEDIKDTLALIIDRRNRIAHEADINALTGEKTEITSQQINDCLEFIKMFIAAIDQIVDTP